MAAQRVLHIRYRQVTRARDVWDKLVERHFAVVESACRKHRVHSRRRGLWRILQHAHACGRIHPRAIYSGVPIRRVTTVGTGAGGRASDGERNPVQQAYKA